MKRLCVFTGLLFLTLPAALHAKTLGTCFSPKGACDQTLVSWIELSTHTLDAAIYGLTDATIAQALIDAHAKGVRVRVVHDKTQAAGRRDVSTMLTAAGIPVHIQRGSRGGIQHNKFLIIDSQYVVTGSFNWTNNATAKNDENFVVLDDVAPVFEAEFNRLWKFRPPPQRPRSRP